MEINFKDIQWLTDTNDIYFLLTVTIATETSYDVCTGRVKFKTVVLKHFYISLLESTFFGRRGQIIHQRETFDLWPADYMCWGPIEIDNKATYRPYFTRHRNTPTHTFTHFINVTAKKWSRWWAMSDDLRNNTRWFLICDSCKRSAFLFISVEAEWYLSDIENV